MHADERSANILKNDPYLYSSSVSQDIHDTHRHVSRSSLPVSLSLQSVFLTLSQIVIICFCFMMMGRTVMLCAASHR